MAKFTAPVPLNIRLPGGFEVAGAVGTTHRIPDSLIEEFIRDQVPSIPGGVTWITQDEMTSAATPASIVTGGISATAVSASTSIVTPSLTATNAVFKGSPWLDAKAYGAVGDGSTDDTAALQLAINALTTAPANATLFIPAGSYKLTSALLFPYMQYKRLLGAGMGATVLMQATANTPVLKTQYEDTHTITIEEMSLDIQTQATSANTSAYGVAFTATSSGVGSGFYYWAMRNVGINKAYVGIGNLGGAGAIPIWGCTFDRVMFTKLVRSAFYFVSPSVTGMPSIGMRDIKVFNSPIINTAAVIESVATEISVYTIDIEDWYGRLFYASGGSTFRAENIHVERHSASSATFLFDVADNPMVIEDLNYAGTINHAAATSIMGRVQAGGSLHLSRVYARVTVAAGALQVVQSSSTAAKGIWVRDVRDSLSAMLNPAPVADTTTWGQIRAYDGTFGQGTAFPTAPLTNDRFLRTDRGIEYYYDGTRWLSVTLYRENMSIGDAVFPLTATGNAGRMATWEGDYDLWLVKLYATAYVITTNTSAAYWTIALRGGVSGSTITSVNTSAIAADGFRKLSATIGALAGTAESEWDVQATKTGAPGNLYPLTALTYRLVG